MARKPAALARELLRNFPKGRRGKSRRKRKTAGATDGAGAPGAEEAVATTAGETGDDEEEQLASVGADEDDDEDEGDRDGDAGDYDDEDLTDADEDGSDEDEDFEDSRPDAVPDDLSQEEPGDTEAAA
jgi:hypothetical protein